MQTLNLSELSKISVLDKEEIDNINGGSFWGELAYLAGQITIGLVIFGREGGRSAGICVR